MVITKIQKKKKKKKKKHKFVFYANLNCLRAT